nr:hypothetical protein Itr_chr05CG20680 [Ipomoea trifida]
MNLKKAKITINVLIALHKLRFDSYASWTKSFNTQTVKGKLSSSICSIYLSLLSCISSIQIELNHYTALSDPHLHYIPIPNFCLLCNQNMIL